MRRVLFVHDGPILKDELGNFYASHFNDALRKRYLRMGSSVTFLMRQKEIASSMSHAYNRLGHENATYKAVPDFKSISLFLKNANKAHRIIEDEVRCHDVLIARMPSAAGAVAVRVAKKYEKPYMLEMVACTYDAYWNYGWRGKLIAHYKLHQFRRIVKEATHVIYVTEKFLQRRYPTEGKSVACSNVEISSVEEVILSKRKRKIKECDPCQLKCITVAAVDVPYKGQADVIRALAMLKGRGIQMEYYLLGKGDSRRLKDLADRCGVGENVYFLGQLPHQSVFTVLQEMDLYIQPSKQEGLPRSLIEAMSLGMPSLGASTAGIPELLDYEMLFSPGNSKQLASVLESIDNGLMLVQSDKNFERSKGYRFDVIEQRRYKFYQSFINDYGLTADE